MAPKRQPRYHTIAEELRRELATLAPNSILPSEERLARRFGVSRITLRLALSVLERAGLLSRQRGRGTIVSPPKVARHIVPVCTLEEDVQSQGLKLVTRVLRFELATPPPERIRQQLGVQPGERVGALWLLREVDDRVICHDERYLPPALAARFDPQLVTQSAVTDILQELAGVDITASSWETEITPARPDVAAALGITPGTLVLVNSFVERFADGHPAEASITSYRIDRVKFLFAATGPALALSASPGRRSPGGGAPPSDGPRDRRETPETSA
jgi:GntR family transcriptional regulator